VHGRGGGRSFTAGTLVLLANGKAVPISSLHVGEMVLATNTKTGKTQPEAVAAVLVHHDTDLYDLKIRDHGKTSVIDTTSNHLFWVTGPSGHSGRWIKAAALRYGRHLGSPSSGYATVLGGYCPKDSTGWMWDLTVPGNDDHDSYIDTISAPVLVHNCSMPGRSGKRFDENQQNVISFAQAAEKVGKVSQEDGEILTDWADEYGLGGHGPAVHPGRPGFGGSTLHINIGPIKHIPVIP
jgi:Pretoxin HINT domain